MTPSPDRPVLELETWEHPLAVFGRRYTLRLAGRAVVTRGTEFEVRAIARANRWRVVKEREDA